MDLSSLSAISPIDGRYGDKTSELRPIFSEFGLMRYRVLVEISWLKTLAAQQAIEEVPALSESAIAELDAVFSNSQNRTHPGSRKSRQVQIMTLRQLSIF